MTHCVHVSVGAWAAHSAIAVNVSLVHTMTIEMTIERPAQIIWLALTSSVVNNQPIDQYPPSPDNRAATHGMEPGDGTIVAVGIQHEWR